jgi:transposase-like protein
MKRTLNHYSQSFRNQVMSDYFSSVESQASCARKWQIPKRTLNEWLKSCVIAKEAIPLHPKSRYMDAKAQALENLRMENERLRREVEYHKLRVASYERLLEIIKQEDGIDLLKKDGAKQ